MQEWELHPFPEEQKKKKKNEEEEKEDEQEEDEEEEEKDVCCKMPILHFSTAIYHQSIHASCLML